MKKILPLFSSCTWTTEYPDRFSLGVFALSKLKAIVSSDPERYVVQLMRNVTNVWQKWRHGSDTSLHCTGNPK